MSAGEWSSGREFETARRTVTEADIVSYAGLSNDFNPLHVDEVFAAATAFGRRIAHGQLIASIVTGLRSELDDWPVLSYLGASRRFSAAVGAGDTIHARYRIKSLRATRSKPDRSVATLELTVLNQDGEEVMAGEDVMLLGPPAAGGESD
jgi:3-hydroxybutyryl-CoA dehydratase